MRANIGRSERMQIAFLLCVSLPAAAATAASCADASASTGLPCLHVPPCASGAVARAENFSVVPSPKGAPLPASEQTSVGVCHTPDGIRVRTIAYDNHIGSPYESCNSHVWEGGSVLEVFIAEVASPYDAPIWYHEIDTGAAGALFAARVNNSRGNASDCEHDACWPPYPAPPDCAGGFLCEVELRCTGRTDFGPAGYPLLRAHVTNSTAGDAWSNDLFIPFDIFPRIGPSRGPWPLYRANFYRYAYPRGRSQPPELSSWSTPPTTADFHHPTLFGILALVDAALPDSA